MIVETPERPKRNAHGNPEAKIQADCVLWMHNERPETRGLYFCVNNENSRSKYESKARQLMSGAQRKAIGVVAGVSDTILLIPRGGFHGLCVEFKTDIGRQSAAQVEWQGKVEAQGYRYVVVRSLAEFKDVVNGYLM